MKILVTGHKGFIGYNLVKYIKENTDWIVSVFDWEHGKIPSVIEQDWVIHIGAISSTTERDLDKIMRQNVDFTKEIFDACKTYGINLQYSSSASLYGLGTDFRETAPLDPRTPYAWSKYLCEYYHQRHQGGNIVQGFRYFNVYGNYEDHKNDQASPISQFRKQHPIKLFENSDNYKRDFIAVEDVCRIHVKFINRVKESGIWNVGTGRVTSFQEVANLIGDHQEYIPMPPQLVNSYQTYTCADLTKLTATIGSQKFLGIQEWLKQSDS
jgi:ADP-L-glycero-D-manno-heptose 6-epimerase